MKETLELLRKVIASEITDVSLRGQLLNALDSAIEQADKPKKQQGRGRTRRMGEAAQGMTPPEPEPDVQQEPQMNWYRGVSTSSFLDND